MKRRRSVFAVFLVILASALLFQCSDGLNVESSGAAPPNKAEPNAIDFSHRSFKNRPNIILICVDTLRADFFTPKHMARLYDFAEKDCLIFTNAHSHSTWTKPSHVTMFTGMLQSRHGVEYVKGAIPEEIVMVQERLKDAGYHTAAFTGGGFLDRAWGFDRGFDSFDQTPFSINSETMDISTHLERLRLPLDKAKEYLSQQKAPPLPTFLFIHTYEVHEWWCRHFPPDTPRSGKKDAVTLWEKFAAETSIDESKRLYGDAVKEVDERLTDLLRTALASPLKDDLCIIITSDHGEGLGEKHGDFISLKHSKAPYSEQIRVPLLVYGIGKGISDRLTGIDEIAPLILWLAGIGGFPFAEERKALVSEYISNRKESPNRAVAILTPEGKHLLTRDGVLHFYMDPEDAIDLLHAQHPGEKKLEIPKNLQRELKALGYID